MHSANFYKLQIWLDLAFAVGNTVLAQSCEGHPLSPQQVRHENAAQRVRRRIAEWVTEQGHGSRKRIADAVTGLYGEPRTASWVTDIIDGPDKKGQDLRLRDLDAVAEVMGVPPGELVRREGSIVLELSHTESRMVRFYRALPDIARQHLVEYFNYIFGLQQKVLETQARERDKRTAETKRMRTAAKEVRKRPPA